MITNFGRGRFPRIEMRCACSIHGPSLHVELYWCCFYPW